MPQQQFTEGRATITATAGAISKRLAVFYNPVMAYNRDISITLLRALGRRQLLVADPLAGSGVRGIRFLKELPPGTVAALSLNDIR
ncbi:MAG TPA: tRNA (guanine(10)-N(2))-dimethyltransferase, partial [Candidatus Nanoarchaeia archaeon]|nr:tRNA (guanine(10)-N(2))-dimethyltransferase [Candidatus Nanoarchaeia archaeon]